MRTYRATNGPFSERVYYTDDEIERICADELRAANLLPDIPQPIRIDRFIERKFHITPQYEDLPDGMLGCTVFGSKGVQAILVSRALSEEGTTVSERRLTTTLAHEIGHGLLHAHLAGFAQQPQSLFESEKPRSDQVLCREDAIFDARRVGPRVYTGDWWEFQANRAIGSLLLPRPLVGHCLEHVLVMRGALGRRVLPQEGREQAVRLLSETFSVNPVVARIRLSTLLPVCAESQLTL